MSRDSSSNLPDELREGIEKKADGLPDPDESPSLRCLWTRLGSARPADSDLPDASETWTGVRRHLEAEASPPPDESSRSSRGRRPPRSGFRSFDWRWTAAAAVLLVTALGAWLWQRPTTVAAEPGTAVTHTLPDGSTVELNGGSRLTYSRWMEGPAFLASDRRTVRVRGEAYFEVRPARRPFVVQTSTARIEVTGTAFAVQADSERTHVALAEGRVQVRGHREIVTLMPGEAVFVARNGQISPPVDTSIQRVTAWRRGGFAVTAQPLPAIARTLERQFGTRIVLSSALSASVTSDPLTLYYSQDVDVETILHDIAMARGLSYRPRAPNGYVLGPADRSSSPSRAPTQP